MTKVLYITAHPHDDTQSYSMAVGKAFIDTYKQVHPDHEVIHLDLYKEYIPEIDVDVFSGWANFAPGNRLKSCLTKKKRKSGA
ncbi:FMN-dependent NADH-azoreductase 2 [Geobacillus sp. BCO2]|nr:FMN-dependent NADH-azoreductase 2 [Geobacillus sp. BCO2]